MLDRYRYRGRHREAVSTGHNVARAAAVVGAVVAPLALAELPAFGDVLDEIQRCESSGNPRAIGPTTEAGAHYGLFQFDLPTWRSVGGTGTPSDASPAEQRYRAALLLEARGTQPWLASQGCWGGKAAPVGAGRVKASARSSGVPTPTRPQRAPQNATQRPLSGSVTVAPGDTLSDIAAAHHVAWRALWRANARAVPDPHLIFPGQRLTLP